MHSQYILLVSLNGHPAELFGSDTLRLDLLRVTRLEENPFTLESLQEPSDGQKIRKQFLEFGALLLSWKTARLHLAVDPSSRTAATRIKGTTSN